MSNPRTIPYESKVWGKCCLEFGNEYRDGSPVIQIDSAGGPVAVLTVNLDLGPLGPDLYLVKTWSENEDIARELLKLGIFQDTGERYPTGFVTANVWKLVK